MKIKPINILIAFLFVFIIFIRFWHVPEFFSFNFDEEYQANLAWSIVKDFHIIWIGVSASNVGYYLGPGFTYLNALLFWLSRGDPVILGYFASFWGIITLISLYYITKNLYSKKIAVIASIFYGFSALIIYFDRRFWNPLPIPFISLWMIYGLIKGQKDPRWFILSAILYGIALHIHLSLVLFLPLIVFVMAKSIKKIRFQVWIFMIIGYFIVTTPLLVYDIVHNYDNLLAPIRFFQNTSDPNHTFNIGRIIGYSANVFSTLGRLWMLKLGTNIQEEHNLGAHGALMTVGNPLLAVISIIALLITIHYNQKRKYYILSLALLLPIVAFIFYPGVAGEYYLLIFMGFFPIAIGIFISRLPILITGPLLTGFIIFNSLTILTTTQEKYGLKTRKKLVQEVSQIISNKDFYLETVGKDPRKYHPYGGWRYLFKIYGKAPAQSHADEFFGWIYSDEISKEKPQLRVIISEEIQLVIKKTIIKQIHEGSYYGYILNYE